MTASPGPAPAGPVLSRPAPGGTAAALQAALAAENAAIYGYGVVGGQLGTAARNRALRDWAQHEAARDQLEAMLASLGVTPAAARPAYQLPFPVHGTGAAISLAGYLENRVAAAYLGIVALDNSRLRVWAAAQARACALRATAWLGRTAAFPGLFPGSGQAAAAGPSASP
jgi:hypothetical protein